MTTSCHLCGGRHWSIDCPQRDELTAGGFVNEIHSLRAAIAERDARIAELRRGLELALDLSDEGWAYVPEYTRDRCSHDGQRALIGRIYAATGAGEGCLECGHPLTDADRKADVCPHCGVA